jgi:putative DNA primase/helicase
MPPPPSPVNQIPQSVVPNVLSPVVPPPPVVPVLPAGLRALERHRQFLLYKLVPKEPKPDKIPVNYLSGKPANPHDAANWADYELIAAIAANRGEGWHVGFDLTAGARIAVIDIDGCRDKVTGQLTDAALLMIAMLAGAYVEVSISGTGIHIWFSYSVEMPEHECETEVDGVKREFYHTQRFFALGTPYVAEGFAQGTVEADLGAMLPFLISMYFPPKPPRPPVDLSNLEPLSADDRERGRNAFRMACEGFEAIKGTGNGRGNALNRLAINAAGKILRGVFDEEYAREEMLKAATHFIDDNSEYYATHQIDRGLAYGYDREPWEPAGLAVELAGFGQSPLPAGALATGSTGAGVEGQGDAITVGSIDLKGIEASLLQQKTQDSVAQIFELKQAGKLLYNHSRGLWMEWDGTRWKYEATQKAFDFTRNLARSLNFGGASSMGSASFCGGVEKFAQASRTFAVEGERFDCDNYLLNTPAGTIDLRTGKMRAHDTADLITKCTIAAPDTVGDGPIFRKFMMEITDSDEELIQFLQVSLGACLSGALEDHWMLFWIGEGRNGKNTLGDLVEELMGDYALKIPASTLMAKTFEGHSAEIAQLQGARIAMSSEINDGDFWHEARIKELSGDATIRARFMRENFFTFRRTHKHLVYGNHRPQLRSVGNAIKSRIKIVPFKVMFTGEREDKSLPGRLRAELGYVLQWLIDGHSKWLAAGKKLPKCAAVEAESADYFASQSTPEMWLAERCEILTEDGRQSRQLPGSSDLYRDYSDWKKARGEQPISQTRWAQGVMRGFEKVQSTWGFRYKGLRLLPLTMPSFGAPDPLPEVVAPPLSDFGKFALELMAREQEIM